MRHTGILTSWNDDRGFGFIVPTQGGADVFVHVSALTRDGTRPIVGERLSYDLEHQRDGRSQAVNVRREALAGARSVRSQLPRQRTGYGRQLAKVLGVLVLAVAVVLAYRYVGAVRGAPGLTVLPSLAADQAVVPAPAREPLYQCDGRKYCSQMTSCAEAKFFLKNCPGTELDGDHDGRPCEQQWCNGLFGR